MQSPLKVGVSLFLLWAAVVLPAAAESKYVAEEFEITLRTGPGLDRKIIALIPAGKLVEVIQKGDEWSEVALPNGKQGFVLTRYLTDQLPTSIVLERLQQKHATLQTKSEELQNKANELSSENKQLKETLSKTQSELTSLNNEHQALRKGSGEYLSLKQKYDQASKDLVETRQKAENFEAEVNKLSHKEFYDGMLYGGGILIVGIVLGLIFRKPKRKQSLL
jgi:SH3 domain protein